MASCFELLPNELLDIIIGQLSYGSLAALLQCSKCFKRRIEPCLYQYASNDAMIWACKHGSLPAIHKAISYGASVSTADVYWQPRNESSLRDQTDGNERIYTKALTLSLAAREGNGICFAALLNLGAQIEDVDDKQIRVLLRRLCSPLKEDLLLCFMRSGLGTKVREERKLRLPLVSIIRQGAAQELVEVLLDDDNQINRRELLGKHIFGTPLSAAILRNSEPLFDLFVGRDADLHCVDHFPQPPHWNRPLHIPVFAAAWVMTKYGYAMMQKCLDAGCDINQWSHVRLGPWMPDPPTPFRMYVESIGSWTPEMAPRIIDGLKFLLQHGAVIDRKVDKYPGSFKGPTALEYLLNRWGVAKLCNPVFFETVEFLMQNGGAKYHAKLILTSDKYKASSYEGGTHDESLVTVWKRFITLLLKHRNFDDQAEKSTINGLFKYIIEDKGPYFDGPPSLFRVSIDYLLEAGADVNWIPYKLLETPLHVLCLNLREQTRMATFQHICSHYSTDPDAPICATAERTFDLFRHLVKYGANANIVGSGHTSYQRLLKDVDRVPGSGRAFLEKLVAILKEGEKARPAAFIASVPSDERGSLDRLDQLHVSSDDTQ